MQAIDSQVAQRGKGWAVRLEIEAGAQAEIMERLLTTFELDEPLVIRVPGMVNLQRLFHLYEETPRPHLKYGPFAARQVHLGHDADLMFTALRHGDVLLHHPYESYDAIVNFVEAAAHDPRGAFDEADVVPREYGFADCPSATGSGVKKRSDSGGGAESELR
jgi:polyphosphate kinase